MDCKSVSRRIIDVTNPAIRRDFLMLNDRDRRVKAARRNTPTPRSMNGSIINGNGISYGSVVKRKTAKTVNGAKSSAIFLMVFIFCTQLYRNSALKQKTLPRLPQCVLHGAGTVNPPFNIDYIALTVLGFD